MTDKLLEAAKAGYIAISAVTKHPTLELSDFLRGKLLEAEELLFIAAAQAEQSASEIRWKSS